MNIFYLDHRPEICAQYHCDKHVVKMIIEYAQLLSTAHRILDGKEYVDSSSGRKIKRWKLPDDRDNFVYKASHVNHPSAIWARQNEAQYTWLFCLWIRCLNEYTHRYGKEHACEKLRFVLVNLPNNIPKCPPEKFSEPPQAMPDDCKSTISSIDAYRQYYIMKKNHFAKWTKRQIPNWYTNGILGLVLLDKQVVGLHD